MKKKFLKTILHLSVILACALCLIPLGVHGYDSPKDPTPKQDAEGYYLLRTKEDFKWFISAAYSNNDINVRLANDLILNDTSDWERWDDTPPENGFGPIVRYNGHFDGNGYALEGYYSGLSPTWQASIFTILEKDARITNLHIRKSFFRTSYEECAFENDNGLTEVVTAASICFSNDGVIEGCDVQAIVMGAWDAGGLVGINYGRMKDCSFTGSVEAGLAQDMGEPKNRFGPDALYAGGICRSNKGSITNCTNAGSITLCTLPDNAHMDYAAGGIAGTSGEEAVITDSENTGNIESVQLAGGIVGASRGELLRCANSGNIHVEQADWEYTTSLISAGICASNGGTIDTCLHTGSATVTQTAASFYAPIYGIACNIVNPGKGTITNCYYLADNTVQAYRQSGVHKLSAENIRDLPAYLTGDKKMGDVDTWALLPSLPNYPGTDENDYIRLSLGPTKDVHYEVKPGDNLWNIADTYYGDGCLYDLLERESNVPADRALIPGEQITVPHKDYYLLRANDEAGIGWSYCVLPSGEPCPTHFIAAKPIDWYYGYMRFEAGAGWDVMWPKDKELGHDAAASDIRILYRFDGNPDGDFFGVDWAGVQQRIRQSAAAYCGDAIDSLHFYRYTLKDGDALYGYSFRLHRPTDTLKCAAFYRIQDGFLAEFVGMEPVGEDEHLLERVRYLAAAVDNELASVEVQSDYEDFYGKENWDFPMLHNPFAAALEYSKDAECSSYMLFTGAQ